MLLWFLVLGSQCSWFFVLGDGNGNGNGFMFDIHFKIYCGEMLNSISDRIQTLNIQCDGICVLWERVRPHNNVATITVHRTIETYDEIL